jgi:hypothetical protein
VRAVLPLAQIERGGDAWLRLAVAISGGDQARGVVVFDAWWRASRYDIALAQYRRSCTFCRIMSYPLPRIIPSQIRAPLAPSPERNINQDPSPHPRHFHMAFCEHGHVHV